jgi:hypothetical protein
MLLAHAKRLRLLCNNFQITIDKILLPHYNEDNNLISSVSGRSESLHRQYTGAVPDSLRAARHDGCESQPTVIVRMEETGVFRYVCAPLDIYIQGLFLPNQTELLISQRRRQT